MVEACKVFKVDSGHARGRSVFILERQTEEQVSNLHCHGAKCVHTLGVADVGTFGTHVDESRQY